MHDPEKRDVTGRRVRLALAFCILAGGLPQGARAQTMTTGVIAGVVRDDRGDPLNAVAVTIINRANGLRIVARTDRAGGFASPLLAPGQYDALFERLGFRPHRLENITVVAGSSRDMYSVLEPLAEGVTTPSVSVAPTMQPTGIRAPDRWIVDLPSSSMPLEGRGVAALLATSSLAGGRHEIEGLPATHTRLVIDGLSFTRRPRGFDVFALDLAVPLWSMSQAGLVASNPDVEHPSAGPSLTAHTLRGGSERTLTGFGDIATDATASGTGTAPSFSSYRAGLLAGGPIVRDTASFIVGGEVLRSRIPYNALWSDNQATTALADAASSAYATDLRGFTEPFVERIDRESAFTRLDMRFSETTFVHAYGLYSSALQPEPVAPWTERRVGSTITPKLRTIMVGASIIARIDEDLMTQIDANYESSESVSRPESDRGAALPLTTIVESGRQFGSDRDPEYLSDLNSFHVRGTLHIRSAFHQRKLALAAELPSYTIPSDAGRGGSFTFADATDFADGTGLFRSLESGTRNRADFSVRRVSVMGQDTWRPNPSVALMVGARVSSFRLPDSAKITLNPVWLNLTGQVNRGLPRKRKVEFEPRFSISISPASRPGLRLRGGVSVDAELADPEVLGEIFNNNGTIPIRTGLDRIRTWPDPPNTQSIFVRKAGLSVIGPEFRGPRSTRAFGSVSQTVSAGLVTVAVAYRRTEFLPQRVDLNLLPGVASYDQHDRPIFGQLQKTRGMLTAEYGTNRRFGSLEEVWGLQANGTSSYTGVTIAAERNYSGNFGFFGSYTISRTEDDWLLGSAGDPYSQLAPFPDSLGPTDWTTGRSDLDVPHRAVIGVEFGLPGALSPRLSALFRYQSGYPFTPGFRPGVDVNADGSGTNDPAYIDESISGVSSLFSEWPCLREDAGTFARRNACRGPNILGLDARLAFTFQKASMFTAAVVIDGLNLIASDAGLVDRALYLVDPAAPLVRGEGTVDIPLVVNPDFGTLDTRYTAQRQLRVGVRVSF